MEDVLHVETDGAVATVWMNRPRVRNALNALLIGGLRETIAGLDADDDIGAIVLTGVDPAFCAGLDLNDVAEGRIGGGSGGAGPPIAADIGTPVIGAVHGPAVAGGSAGCSLPWGFVGVVRSCWLMVPGLLAGVPALHRRAGKRPATL